MLKRIFKRANVSLILLTLLAVCSPTVANAATIPMKTPNEIAANMGVG